MATCPCCAGKKHKSKPRRKAGKRGAKARGKNISLGEFAAGIAAARTTVVYGSGLPQAASATTIPPAPPAAVAALRVRAGRPRSPSPAPAPTYPPSSFRPSYHPAFSSESMPTFPPAGPQPKQTIAQRGRSIGRTALKAADTAAPIIAVGAPMAAPFAGKYAPALRAAGAIAGGYSTLRGLSGDQRGANQLSTAGVFDSAIPRSTDPFIDRSHDLGRRYVHPHAEPAPNAGRGGALSQEEKELRSAFVRQSVGTTGGANMREITALTRQASSAGATSFPSRVSSAALDELHSQFNIGDSEINRDAE